MLIVGVRQTNGTSGKKKVGKITSDNRGNWGAQDSTGLEYGHRTGRDYHCRKKDSGYNFSSMRSSASKPHFMALTLIYYYKVVSQTKRAMGARRCVVKRKVAPNKLLEKRKVEPTVCVEVADAPELTRTTTAIERKR